MFQPPSAAPADVRRDSMGTLWGVPGGLSVSDAGGVSQSRGPHDEPDEVLRAKYLDYCSAQVADLLLLLSPDQIYLLAQEAAEEAETAGDLSYEDIVRLATDRISRKLVLPPFDVWIEDYRAHPEFYDRYLMGFWQSEMPRTPEP